MYKDYSELLPPMLFGEELKNNLTSLPEYSGTVRELQPGQRMLRLMDIYKVFIPSTMAIEIYHKLYMMTALSLKQKGTKESIQRLNHNHQHPPVGEFCGVITGASSATIIGDSGIGKTTCIQKAVELLGGLLQIEKPKNIIIPVLMVTCPFDSNYKGLLCQILISLDEALGTNYYEKSQKSTMNAQQILGLVCQLCHLHVGILIIDEIQFLVQHKSGTLLYKMILQLINTSGIGVVLVGTNECLDYFSQAPQMARRMTGLQYGNLAYDADFRKLAETLFYMQYTKTPSVMNEGVLSWLYEHTSGNAANLMALIHDAQELAMMKGTEILDVSALTQAYSNRMQMLHGYIEVEKKVASTSSKPKREEVPNELQEERSLPEASQEYTIADLVALSKNTGRDIMRVFQEYFTITEVSIS